MNAESKLYSRLYRAAEEIGDPILKNDVMRLGLGFGEGFLKIITDQVVIHGNTDVVLDHLHAPGPMDTPLRRAVEDYEEKSILQADYFLAALVILEHDQGHIWIQDIARVSRDYHPHGKDFIDMCWWRVDKPKPTLTRILERCHLPEAYAFVQGNAGYGETRTDISSLASLAEHADSSQLFLRAIKVADSYGPMAGKILSWMPDPDYTVYRVDAFEDSLVKEIFAREMAFHYQRVIVESIAELASALQGRKRLRKAVKGAKEIYQRSVNFPMFYIFRELAVWINKAKEEGDDKPWNRLPEFLNYVEAEMKVK
ncbi:MAG: hypothetical protein KJ709_04570 [Nanoarchaeota archaeon]|nr:hypothetical protein [Nanoarchaeota archaeon]